MKVSDGEVLGVASTEAMDRQGESIKQDGWDLKNFKQNPAILASHNYFDFPIGKATGIKVVDGKLLFKAVFSQSTQKAIEAYQLIKEGILNTFSVGFIAREFDAKDNNIITKAELLEISVVSVPANPQAVVLAKGLEGNHMARELVKHWIVNEETKGEEGEEKEEKKDAEPKEEQEEKTIGQKLDELAEQQRAMNALLQSLTKKTSGSLEEDKTGEEEKVEDLNLKLLQKVTGGLQEVCRELKKARKEGAN